MSYNVDKGAKRRLLEELTETLSVTAACQRAGVSRSTYYRLMEDDIIFARQARVAKMIAIDKVREKVQSKIEEGIDRGDYRAIDLWEKRNSQLEGMQEYVETVASRYWLNPENGIWEYQQFHPVAPNGSDVEWLGEEELSISEGYPLVTELLPMSDSVAIRIV